MNWWEDEREKRQFARWLMRKDYIDMHHPESVLDFLDDPFGFHGTSWVARLRLEYEAEETIAL